MFQDLMSNNKSWVYALDMAGSEMMMLTNRELVANISSYPDKIFTESFPLPSTNYERIKYRWEYDGNGGKKKNGLLDPPPFNLKVYKGAKAWKAPRAFIKFLLEHHVAKTYLGKITFP